MKLIRKITDQNHSSKYITNQKLNNWTSGNFAARLKQANLASKTDIPDITSFVKMGTFDDRLKI